MEEAPRVIIIAGFLQLASADEAVARVAQRVRQGGHDIPEALVRRRFAAGMDNFKNLYAPSVDSRALYDNAGSEPMLIDWSNRV
jgi:predicted ABC-type ATPase